MNAKELIEKYGPREAMEYDVVVVGGGPAGSSAAIYAARKGIRTGVVADRFGGQVMDTLGIENFISVKATEAPTQYRITVARASTNPGYVAIQSKPFKITGA